MVTVGPTEICIAFLDSKIPIFNCTYFVTVLHSFTYALYENCILEESFSKNFVEVFSTGTIHYLHKFQ